MPTEFKKYFWDTQFENLDLRKNMKYIISRLFCEGNWESIKWVKKNYTKEQIIETAKTSRRLTPMIANFLKNVYNLKKEEMQYYINNENMNYTFGG